MTYVPTRDRVKRTAAVIGGSTLVGTAAAIADVAGLVPSAAMGAANAHRLLVGVEVMAFVAAAAAWLSWQYRAHRNLVALGDRPRLSPRHAVAAWFVPIVNLIHAPRALHELSVLSRRRAHREEHARWLSPRFFVWWVSSLLSAATLLVVVAAVAMTPAEVVSPAVTGAHVASAALRVAAAVFAIRIASDIAARQDRRHAMTRFRVVRAA